MQHPRGFFALFPLWFGGLARTKVTPMMLIAQSAAGSPSPVVDAPPAYGYLRVPDDVPDRKVLRLEQALIAFAESEGLSFAGFFFEFECGSRKGFNELIAELVRTGARHVVVPSLRHLALNTRLQDAMQDRLARDAGAVVLAALPSAEAQAKAMRNEQLDWFEAVAGDGGAAGR